MNDISAEVVHAVRRAIGDTDELIQLHVPVFEGNEKEYLNNTIEEAWVATGGRYVGEFESMIAEITGAERAIAMANGTVALHLAQVVAGVQPGDEVLVPALTFVATANAISHAGAIPHFCEVSETDFAVDPDLLAAYLADIVESRDGQAHNRLTGRRLSALMPVHIFGHPARAPELRDVADRFGLTLIEDAAEALGTLRDGVHVGHDGLCSMFSFNGNKIVTTGGGGVLITNDHEFADKVAYLATTAKKPHRWDYIHDEVGYNYRLPNLNAALGVAQLERFEGLLKSKRAIADMYRTAFSETDAATFIEEPEGARSNFWLNGVVLADDQSRDDTLQALHDAGYAARPIWEALHRLPMYESNPRMSLDVTEDIRSRVVNLPSSPRLADQT